MTNTKMRKILLVCCAATALVLLVPATTQACEFLDRLMPWNWCGGAEATASTYAPAYSVQYPVATQTCCYVPQTSYRTQMRTVPTTVYRAASTYCDPCTGCATTCYSPITSYVRCAQLVPYTTYTPVWTTSYCSPCATSCYDTTCCPTACGSACGSTCGTSCGTYTNTTGGCSSCATPAPASTLTPMPAQGTTTTPSNSGSSTPQPSLPSGTSTPRYQQNKPIAPVPDSEIRGSSLGGPQLDDPSGDRVTLQPAVIRTAYQAVSHQSSNNVQRVDYSGWRAADK